PKVLVVRRSQVEVRECQCGEGKRPYSDQQPTAGPQRALVGTKFVRDFFRGLLKGGKGFLRRNPFSHVSSPHATGGRGSSSPGSSDGPSRSLGDTDSPDPAAPTDTSDRAPRSATGGASTSP